MHLVEWKMGRNVKENKVHKSRNIEIKYGQIKENSDSQVKAMNAYAYKGSAEVMPVVMMKIWPQNTIT